MTNHLQDRHYASLTAHERFALMLEAMARRDDSEADRLEDTCPRFVYRGEDQAFRDRMRRAYTITSYVCLNMRAGLAQMRLARLFREQSDCFAGPVGHMAQLVFLYGRECGKCAAGVIESVGLPNQAAIDREVAADEELRGQLQDLTALAEDALSSIGTQLVIATGKAHASDLLSQWEGFGRFCRELLGVEPLTLTAAFGLERKDPALEVRQHQPEATADLQTASEWAECWIRNWQRRFN